ncbi:MAG: hypothetical protein D6806_10455 [Deltaproteobacteria bacterium]|nr:MAG: hypothetical protein D6806_10455 [Deltaproteobacteria bacterium]
MFRLAEWFTALRNGSDELEGLSDVKLSVGVILYHVIVADEKKTRKELDRFAEIFTRQFDEPRENIARFFDRIAQLEDSLEEHLDVIRQHLVETGQDYSQLFRLINDMIIVDGVDNREYKLFYAMKDRFDGVEKTEFVPTE